MLCSTKDKPSILQDVVLIIANACLDTFLFQESKPTGIGLYEPAFFASVFVCNAVENNHTVRRTDPSLGFVLELKYSREVLKLKYLWVD